MVRKENAVVPKPTTPTTVTTTDKNKTPKFNYNRRPGEIERREESRRKESKMQEVHGKKYIAILFSGINWICYLASSAMWFRGLEF